MYILSKCHPVENIVWDESGIIGMSRFLKKVERLCKSVVHVRQGPKGLDERDETLKGQRVDVFEKYQSAMEKRAFHNAISHLIKYTHSLTKYVKALVLKEGGISDTRVEDVEKSIHLLLLMLYPFATKMCRRLLDDGLFETRTFSDFMQDD